MKIEIDSRSGFCFGVVKAIEIAEQHLSTEGGLFCIGDIVHNGQEVSRLQKLGLSVISSSDLASLKGKRVLIRAHGEPPSTYALAQTNGIELIDATCPVVLRLQQRVKAAWEQVALKGGTVLLHGKKGHAEVIGIVGQTNGAARVIEQVSDLNGVDFSQPIELFSQTTMDAGGYNLIALDVENRMKSHFPQGSIPLTVHSTICGQVANRKQELLEFAKKHDVILFVGGVKSSNAKTLFETCLQANPNSFFVTEPNDIAQEWLTGASSVGICGATSTPQWLMNEVAKKIAGK